MGKHVVVLGGGVSGLGVAWRLACRGVSVDVLEADSDIGGLAKTIKQDGYHLDMGPHSFFSEEEWLVRDVLNLFDYTLEPRPRTVKFFYKNRHLDYPLTPRGILFQMGIFSGIRVAFSYLRSRLLPRRNTSLGTSQENVEDWAIANFGQYLYRSFFKPYTEQFWKVPCTELSSRSIPTHTRMSFFNTLKLLLGRRISKGDASLVEREMLPTYYPQTGFGEIPEKIAETIKKLGGNVHANCEVTGVSELKESGMRVAYNDNGRRKEIESDYVVSTIPLPCLVKMLNPAPPAEAIAAADKLDYRSLVVLGMATEKQNVLGCSYVYMLDRPYNRISEMNEFSPLTSPSGENIITVEIPCLPGSTAWTSSKEELFDMCVGSLAEDGFLGPGDVKRLFLVKAPSAYPIYRKNYSEHLNRLLACLKKYTSLSTLGRCGEFMYMDIDMCIIRAFKFADNLLEEWQV